MIRRATSGYTLAELLVVVMAASIAASLLLPALFRAGRNDRITRCAANLRGLWTGMKEHATRTGGSMPVDTGSAFWSRLDRPAGDATGTCPLRRAPAPGPIHYRGPASDVNRLPDGAAVGADLVDNHSSAGLVAGGNVLRKGGDVQTVVAQDLLWHEAESRTR